MASTIHAELQKIRNAPKPRSLAEIERHQARFDELIAYASTLFRNRVSEVIVQVQKEEIQRKEKLIFLEEASRLEKEKNLESAREAAAEAARVQEELEEQKESDLRAEILRQNKKALIVLAPLSMLGFVGCSAFLAHEARLYMPGWRAWVGGVFGLLNLVIIFYGILFTGMRQVLKERLTADVGNKPKPILCAVTTTIMCLLVLGLTYPGRGYLHSLTWFWTLQPGIFVLIVALIVIAGRE